MIEILFVITLVLSCLILCGIFGAAAGYYRGLADGVGKLAVEQKREIRYLRIQMNLWQNKFVQRTGAGSLTGERFIRPPENKPPKRIIESPSEANLRTREKTDNPLPPTPLAIPEPVPRKVREEFLTKAAAITANRS